MLVEMENPVTAGEWTCPTCRRRLATAFCPQCGERPVRPFDFSLRGLAGKLLHALTNVDGRLLRTLGCLLRKPGFLTVAYMNGPRRPYVAPFQLFLFANVLFFAVQSLSSANIFGATLESHLHNQDWSDLAASLVTQCLETKHRSLEGFAPVFDHAAALNAKTLIILMVVPFALILPLVFLRSRQPFMTHVVFSLHLYAFLLLLFSLSLLVASLDVIFGGAGLGSPRMDNALSAFNLIACLAYLFFAMGPVYGATWPLKLIKAFSLAVLMGALVLAYRFAIFLVTLYGT